MQRRAAAIYVVFFLVVGTAAYSLIATAQQPTIQFENPDYRVSQNDTFDVGDRTYTVDSISAQMEGGGHGSAPTLVRSGTLSWLNESAQSTETWDNNTTVMFQNTDYLVVIPNESDPSSATLREQINKTAILRNESNAANQTVVVDGQEYVAVTNEDGTRRLVPAGEYFPAPGSRTLEEGESFDYNGNETTVQSISSSAVSLTWSTPQRETVEVSDQGNVTLNGQTYLGLFPSNETLVLAQDFQSYRSQTEAISAFHRHQTGLWGVTILSGLVSLLLLGMAYLPSRY